MAGGSPLQRPRRILLISYEYPPVGGGDGKFASNTARCLTALGFEVAVLTSKFKDQPREDAIDGVLVLRVPVLRRYLNYANALEVLSFAVSACSSVRRTLTRFAPDLTVAYHSIPAGWVGRRIEREIGAPCLTWLLGQDVPGYPEPSRWMHALAWPLNRHIWRRSFRLIANSQGLADLALRSAPDLKIDVVSNGVDIDLYRPPAQPRPAGPTQVVFIGRLVKYKRLRVLIEAWARVIERAPGATQLSIAGFGPEREPIERLAKDRGLTDSIKFLGRIDQPTVVRTLQEADLFVSLAEMEGLPNSVLEAMACGLPTVLSDIGPHRELIADPPAGLLCDGADPVSVAESIIALVADPARRIELGRTARRTVETRFAWPTVTAQLAALFP